MRPARLGFVSKGPTHLFYGETLAAIPVTVRSVRRITLADVGQDELKSISLTNKSELLEELRDAHGIVDTELMLIEFKPFRCSSDDYEGVLLAYSNEE